MSRIGRGISQQVIRGVPITELAGNEAQQTLAGFASNIGPQPPQVISGRLTQKQQTVAVTSVAVSAARRARTVGVGYPNFGPRQTGSAGTVGIANDSSTSSGSGVTATSTWAQSFIPATNLIASAIQVYVGRLNSPTQPLSVAIYSDANGAPGSSLASGSIPLSAIPSSGSAWMAVTVTPLALSAGTRYWIVLSSTDTSPNGILWFYTNQNFPGAYLRSTTGTSGPWSVLNLTGPGVAFAFRVSASFPLGAAMLGPRPPVLVSIPYSGVFDRKQAVVSVTSVAVANRARASRYFPPQWYEPSETDVGSPRPNAASIIVYPERSLGPDPPQLVSPVPLAQGQGVLTVTLNAVSRARDQASNRRFPLQGWEQEACNLAASQAITNDYVGNSGNSTGSFGTTATQMVAQEFARLSGSPFVAYVRVRANNSPADGVQATIQSDSGGVPSGTVIASSQVIPASSLPTSGGGQAIPQVSFQFDPPSAPFAAPVWLVIARTGTLDNTNDYVWAFPSANIRGSAEGTLKTFNGTSWVDQARVADAVVQFASTTTVLPLQRRFLGPRPPTVLLPLSTQPQQTVNTGVQFSNAVMQRAQAQRRAPKSLLFPITNLAQPPPVVTTVAVTLAKTRPRKPTSFYTQALALFPLAVITTPGQLQVKTQTVRRVTRQAKSSLPVVIGTASTATFSAPVAPLVRTRARRTTHLLAPPTVLQTFSGPQVTLAKTRRRGPFVSRFIVPATLEPEAVAIAEREPRVVLVRTRPRHTLGTKLGYTVYPATSAILTTLVRTRPRPTRHALTAVTYAQTSVIQTHLVRTRPRPTQITRHALAFYAQAGIGFQHLVRTRPRPTTHLLLPPATLEPEPVALAERTIRVALVRTRPRPTLGTRVSYVVYPATSEISVTLARIRPRPTTRRLAAPTTLQVFTGPQVTLVRTRPRPTRKYLTPPTVIRTPSVEQREQTISVTLVRTRPRPTTRFIVPPLVKTFPPVVTTLLPAKLVQTRPRPTRKYLEPPTAVIPLPTLRMQTVSVAVVHTRPRPTHRFLQPPATLQPYAVELAEDTIGVKLVRTRPRHTLGTRLGPLIFYRTTSKISVTLVRTRPRPTAHRLTAIRYAQTGTGFTRLVQLRPRKTHSFLLPPATLEPEPVALAERTIRVALVRTRPRPTTRFLAPPTALRTFAGPTVHLVRTRPRPTIHRAITPTVVRVPSVEQVEDTIRVTLARTRPRHTVTFLEPPTTLRAAFTAGRTGVTLGRTRPRATRKFLLPPTVVAPAPTRNPTQVIWIQGE